MKGILIWLSVSIAAILGLSYFANIPYIYTILGISAWVFIGHLITLDDDMPSGWSNPDGSVGFWRSSMLELLIKLLVLFTVLVIFFMFPGIKEYGA
jgi:hypothetical protein